MHVDGQLKVIVADSEEKVPFLVLICKVPGLKKKKKYLVVPLPHGLNALSIGMRYLHHSFWR